MRRFWPGSLRRSLIALLFALLFALVSAAAGGAGYAWIARPYAAELAAFRSQVAFADYVQHRVVAMTPTERRQFDSLMRFNTAPKR